MTGTLGKALGGAAGGYVASSAEVCDLLAQRSRPQLFSNALPPTVACSARAAVRTLRERPDLVAKLRENGWNISKTAEVIDTPRSNLYKKIERYGLQRDGAEGGDSGEVGEAIEDEDD